MNSADLAKLPLNHPWRQALSDGTSAGPAIAAPKPIVQRHTTGTMNKTEAAFARRLDGEKLAGDVVAYWFEAVTLRLADRSRYTPDFLVLRADRRLVMCEVKGPHVREDAVVKWKQAAELFPMFLWQMWQRVKGEFQLIRESEDIDTIFSRRT